MFRSSIGFIILFLAAVTVRADEITITPCRNGGNMPNFVSVEGCNQEGCTIWDGVPVVVTGQLNTTTISEVLTVRLVAAITEDETDDMVMDLPEEVSDGCRMVPSGCPLVAGQVVDIRVVAALDVPEFARGATLPLEMMVTNERDYRVLCFQTMVTVE